MKKINWWKVLLNLFLVLAIFGASGSNWSEIGQGIVGGCGLIALALFNK